MTWIDFNHPLGAVAWIDDSKRFVIVHLGPVFLLFTVGKKGHSRHDELKLAQDAAKGVGS